MRLTRIWCGVKVIGTHSYGNITPMITAGSYPPISIDLGSNEPSMTLQRRYREGGKLMWRDVVTDGEVVKSPVDIDALPTGVYQLVG